MELTLRKLPSFQWKNIQLNKQWENRIEIQNQTGEVGRKSKQKEDEH